MTRYLEADEKMRSRNLWEEVFPEDSASFLDYYYSEVVKDNQILAIERDGRILSMAHVNPYTVKVGQMLWRSGYLVAVATEEKERHKGYMREILNRILKDSFDRKIPFLFLMPADEAIYLPFDFTFIYEQPKFKLEKEAEEKLVAVSCRERDSDYRLVAKLMNRWLTQQAELFARRTQELVRRLHRELKSENGNLEILFDGEAPVGVRSFWGIQKKEERLLYAPSWATVPGGRATPAIMARIVDLKTFLTAIRLKDSASRPELSVELTVKDRLLLENDGTFLWTLDHHSSRLLPAGAGEVALSLDIRSLTSWLFGYGDCPDGADALRDIRTIEGVYLDEIV